MKYGSGDVSYEESRANGKTMTRAPRKGLVRLRGSEWTIGISTDDQKPRLRRSSKKFGGEALFSSLLSADFPSLNSSALAHVAATFVQVSSEFFGPSSS
jgi:hypothetical protein